MTTKLKIPKIRFKEFSWEWEEKKLWEVSQVITKWTTPSYFSKTWIKFIKIECLNDNIIDNSKCLFISDEIHNKELKRSILEENDLLFAIAWATIWKCTIVKKENLPSNTNQALSIIRLKNNISHDYVLSILKSVQMRKYILLNISVWAQPNLNLEQMWNFNLNLPSLPEQQKISQFLSSVDEKIEKIKEKKKNIEDYKKWVMQKIFNQEIRFKDENWEEFGEWEEKSLGKLSKITTWSSNREDSNLDWEYTFFDRSEDIRTSNIYLFDCEAIIVPWEWQRFMPKYFIGKFDLHQRSYAIMNFENLNWRFLYYYIIQNQNYFLSQAVGSTVKSLRLPMFQKMPINLPTLKEQEKIADFLSGIDEKIEKVSDELEKMEEFKKGLLQGMFV